MSEILPKEVQEWFDKSRHASQEALEACKRAAILDSERTKKFAVEYFGGSGAVEARKTAAAAECADLDLQIAMEYATEQYCKRQFKLYSDMVSAWQTSVRLSVL